MASFKLDLFDPVNLLRQLNEGVPGEALSTLDSAKYPHWHVLHNYFLTDNESRRSDWARCVRSLISIKAPIDHESNNVSSMLSFGVWAPTTDLTAALAHEYIDAGFFDTSKRYEYEFVMGRVVLSSAGVSPLATAIRWNNPGFVRVLCQTGASLNLGPVVPNGPDREAFEFASEIGDGEVMGVLAEYLMRQLLKGPDNINLPDQVTPKSIVQPLPDRRRMRTI